MKTDFITRFVAVFLCFIFLSNDLVATTKVIVNGLPTQENFGGGFSRPIIAPKYNTGSSAFHEAEVEISESEMPDVKLVEAAESSALIGMSMRDPMSNPRDDFFSFYISNEDKEIYEVARVSYQMLGVKSESSLTKSINDGPAFGGAEIEPFNEWVEVEEMVSVAELREGVNLMRFSLPFSTRASVEVKDFKVSLMKSGEPDRLSYLEEELVEEENQFVYLGGGQNLVKRYRASDVQVPSIPRDITNVTKNAYAYRLRSQIPIGGGLIGIGIDMEKLPPGKTARDVSTFYFNYDKRGWVPVSADSVHVDRESGIVMNYVPMQQGMQYFNGILQAPNMPESSANLSTSLGNIQPANPSEGLVGVAPPSISRTGEAATSFPIKLPPGRNGMSPSLSVNYSSDAGTGWLGVGWGVTVPKISVDTRWGVPTFPSNIQDEVYLLNGESLAQQGEQKGNRTSFSSPTSRPARAATSTVYFFEKTRSSYRTIKREGTNPTNYVWEVTEADQTKFYYGTTNGTAVDNGSVLYDPSASTANIVEWYLTKVVDKWGNKIEYEYTTSAVSSSNQMIDGAQQRVLSKITYTGFEDNTQDIQGNYAIYFVSSDDRPDATVHMRYGFKVADQKQLDQIIVQYGASSSPTPLATGSEEVRTYEFAYENGSFSFFKNRLTTITEKVGGSEFYRNSFTYNDAKYSFDPNVSSIINTPTGNSPLGYSTVQGSTHSGGLAFGFGLTSKDARCNSVGAKYGQSNQTISNLNVLRDMNGDGIPDLVYNSSFYPGQYDEDRNFSLGTTLIAPDYEPSLGTGTPMYSKTKSHAIAAEARIVAGSVGLSWNWSSTKTPHYFTDVNADGIADISHNGETYFGQYDVAQDKFEYTSSSQSTPNPIVNNANLVLAPDQSDVWQEVQSVRSWRAPFTGTVDISEAVSLIQQSTDGANFRIDYATGDGSYSSTIYSSTNINAGASTSISLYDLEVTKGDFLYFRVGSKSSSRFDFATWDPQVAYHSGSLLDANGVDYGTFKASDEFTLFGRDVQVLEAGQSIEVEVPNTPISSQTDELVFTVHISEDDGSTESVEEHSYTLAPNTSNTLSTSDFIKSGSSFNAMFNGTGYTIASGHTVSIWFEVSSRSNVKWSAINWRPEISSTLGSETEVFYPVVDLTFYDDPLYLDGAIPYTTLSSYQFVKVLPYIDQGILTALPASSDPYEADFTVKTNGAYLKSYHITIDKTAGTIVVTSNDGYFLPTDLQELYDYCHPEVCIDYGDVVSNQVFFEFTTDNVDLANLLVSDCGVITQEGEAEGEECFDLGEQIVRKSDVYLRSGHDAIHTNVVGWGAFGWADDDVTISPTSLVLFGGSQAALSNLETEIGALDETNYQNLETIADNYGVSPVSTSNHFRPMTPQRGEYQVDNYFSLIGQTGSAELDRWSMTLQPFGGVFETKVVPVIVGEDPTETPIASANAPTSDWNRNSPILESTSYNYSESANFGVAGFGINGSGTVYENLLGFGNKPRVSFMDINGDSYPDNVRFSKSEDKLKWQGTNPLGGYTSGSLSNLRDNFFISRNRFESDAIGVGYSLNGGINGYASSDQSTAVTGGGGASAGGFFSTSEMIDGIMDFNGDGIADYVSAGSQGRFENNGEAAIYLGNGKGFNSSDVTYLPIASSFLTVKGASFNTGASGSVSNSCTASPFTIGLGWTIHEQETEKQFIDFNGDGLPDQMTKSGSTWSVLINTGTQLTTTSKDVSNSDRIIENETRNLSLSTGISIATGVTGGFTIPSYSLSLILPGSKERVYSSFIDINGDGYLDLVEKNPSDEYRVHLNESKAVNLLKSVRTPLGGEITLEYDRIGNAYGFKERTIYNHQYEPFEGEDDIFWDMPNSKWVLSSVTVSDNFLTDSHVNSAADGADEYTTFFKYDGGMYSRREREFLGFTRIAQVSDEYVEAGGSVSTKTLNDQDKVQNWSITDFHSVQSTDPIERREMEYLKGTPVVSYRLIHVQEYQEGQPHLEDWITMSIDRYSYSYFYWLQEGGNKNTIDLTKPVNFSIISEAACVFRRMDYTENIAFIDDSEYFYATKLEYTYDEYANVTEVYKNGLTSPGSRSLVSAGTYGDNLPRDMWDYSMSFSVDVIALMDYFDPSNASSQTGMMRRHRIFVIDTLDPANLRRQSRVFSLTGPNGKKLAPRVIGQNTSSTNYSNTTLTYDTWGNVAQADLPANAEGDVLSVLYTYETMENSFVSEIKHSYLDYDGAVSSSFHETTKFKYDLATGLLRKKIDANGHPMEFYYDDFHRPKYIYGPRELAAGPYSVRYQYFNPISLSNWLESDVNNRLDETHLPWSITHRYIGNNPSETQLGDWITSDEYSGAIDDVNQLHAESRTVLEPALVQDASVLRSSVMLDGAGRVVQQKQELSDHNGSENKKGLLASGLVVYDNWGRPVMNYQYKPIDNTAYTQFVDLRTFELANTTLTGSVYFDKYGRSTESYQINNTHVGGGAVEMTKVESDVSWVVDDVTSDRVIRNTTTLYGDPTSARRIYMNSYGQTYRVDEGDGGSQWTSTWYDYDRINQLNGVKDPMDLWTYYEYDLLGRPTQETHLDKGVSKTSYDAAGNITDIFVSNLINGTADVQLSFEYEYNRMTKKIYPETSDMNNVSITWGKSSNQEHSNNAIGRPLTVEQGDGSDKILVDSYAYNEFGQRVREERTIAVPWAGEHTFKTDYVYDSWGRLKHMRYPDGEKLEYAYAAGGELQSVSSSWQFINPNASYYISEIQYEGNGGRAKLIYGNGTVTDYTYDVTTFALKESTLKTSTNNSSNAALTILDKAYTYNASGNLESVINSASALSLSYNKLGGSYEHHYEYDAWNRLKSANGEWHGDNDQWGYDLNMTYGADGRILSKNQTVTDKPLDLANGVEHPQVNYDLSYTYETGTHQLDVLNESGLQPVNYNYDNRGNLVEKLDGNGADKSVYFLWDEVDRLVAVAQNEKLEVQHNVYDPNGIRLMKTTANDVGVWQNGEKIDVDWEISPYVIYAGPHYVFQMYQNAVDVSKHYFADGERISTRMQLEERYYVGPGHEPGEGPFFNQYDPDYTGEGLPEPTDPPKNNAVLQQWDDIGVWVQNSEDLNASGIDMQGLPTYAFFGWTRDACLPSGGTLFNSDFCNCIDELYENEPLSAGCELFPNIFWYHADHLGSTEFVTDLSGMPYEHYFYLPFGEMVVAQHQNNDGYSNPYKFTAAEHDPETGLVYMGARFYDPKASMWLSADPLSHLREWLTPYNYVRNNPVMFVDPTGLSDLSRDNGPGDPPGYKLYKDSDGKYFILSGGERYYWSEKLKNYVSKTGDSIMSSESTELGEVTISDQPDWMNERNAYEGYSGVENSSANLKRTTEMASFAMGVATLPWAQGATGTGASLSGVIALAPAAGGVIGFLGLTFYIENYGVFAPDPSYTDYGNYTTDSPISFQEAVKRTKAREKIEDLRGQAPSPQNGYVYLLKATETRAYPCFTCGNTAGIIILNAGDIWKIGYSADPSSRYRPSDLPAGVSMEIVYEGPKNLAFAAEKALLLGYWYLPENLNRPSENGGRRFLPAGNKIYR